MDKKNKPTLEEYMAAVDEIESKIFIELPLSYLEKTCEPPVTEKASDDKFQSFKDN